MHKAIEEKITEFETSFCGKIDILKNIQLNFSCYKEEIDKIANLEDTEDCWIDQLVDLQIRINEITVKAESTIYSSNQESASNYGEQNHLRVKLPKLNINNFSGNINKWTNIWALFEGNIYSNPMFNNKEKFAYLLGFLKGEPLNLV
ncbi:hypothetical protein RF11_05302 [Thelohanellus kitauei]|uniref:Uncharacterized protein n=1 Tax=Thelohanellus kitauei TaxID=669202 RepID=A0A0C2IUB6_THEKT|nr:hypothetical protein RF11_05302 [Thelohanellus kitauei]